MSARILFAEDDDSVRPIVVRMLQEEGFIIEAVDDGTGAIEALEKNAYDLILLDIRMPIKTGLDVLEFMRERNIRTRIIMATAMDDIATAIQTLKLGANDFITKPYSLETLVSSIHKVLDK
jgi:DNA-binding response OmpR family regulator